MPPIAPAWAVLGKAAPALACPPHAGSAGAHDSNAAFLRYLAGSREPFALISTGNRPSASTPRAMSLAFWPSDTLANIDVLGRPVASARFMGGREYAAIAEFSGQASP